MERLEIKRLDKSFIAKKAAEFLSRYHPSLEIPVPIELIVEHQLHMNIVPVPGMRQSFGNDGMISSDLTTITVDNHMCVSNRPGRYRFTLAHEIGHRVLHGEFYSQFDFSTMAEYHDAMQWIQDSVIGGTKLEWQASEFAGRILVPTTPLRREFTLALDEAKGAGIDIKENEDLLLDYISSSLAKRFEVSNRPMEIRLEREGLRPLLQKQP